ncbi:hypothetical protein [Priestia aryabhattai]
MFSSKEGIDNFMELLKQQEMETVQSFKLDPTESKPTQRKKKSQQKATNSNRKAAQELKRRDPFYNQYIIFDSSKPLSIKEYEKLKRVLGKGVQIWEGELQRFIYKFPNGCGLSVVKSTHTSEHWETTDIRFSQNALKQSIHKKKRLRKKLLKKHNLHSSIATKINKYKLFSDVEKHMAQLYAVSS